MELDEKTHRELDDDWCYRLGMLFGSSSDLVRYFARRGAVGQAQCGSTELNRSTERTEGSHHAYSSRRWTRDMGWGFVRVSFGDLWTIRGEYFSSVSAAVLASEHSRDAAWIVEQAWLDLAVARRWQHCCDTWFTR